VVVLSMADAADGKPDPFLVAASLRAETQAIKAHELTQKGAARLQQAATGWDDEGNDDDARCRSGSWGREGWMEGVSE